MNCPETDQLAVVVVVVVVVVAVAEVHFAVVVDDLIGYLDRY